MQFRIGINLGDVIQEQDRIFGDGVNIAARLEALAQTGTLVSQKGKFALHEFPGCWPVSRWRSSCWRRHSAAASHSVASVGRASLSGAAVVRVRFSQRQLPKPRRQVSPRAPAHA